MPPVEGNAMDNFSINIVDRPRNLAKVLMLALRNYKAKGWAVSCMDGEPDRLMLFWSVTAYTEKQFEDAGAPISEFPVGLDAEQGEMMVQAWLAEQGEKASKPDLDGSCGLGFCVWTDAWGHIWVPGSKDLTYYGICSICFQWALYGKEEVLR